MLAILLTLAHSGVKADGSTIALSYNWPAGLEVDVSYRVFKERLRQGKTLNNEVSGSLTYTTSDHKKGLIIETSNTQVKVEQASESGGQLQRFMQRLAAIDPSYIITQEGVLSSVGKLDELKQSLSEEYEQLTSDLPEDVKNQTEGLMAKALSEESIFASISQDWNRDVAQWIGADFEVGYLYDVEYTTPVPMLGNAQVPTKGTYQVFGYVPCSADAGSDIEHFAKKPTDNSANCVEMYFTSNLIPAALVDVMEQMFKSMGQEMPENFEMKIDYEVFVITEPDTLLPHSVNEVKVITASAPQEVQPLVQTEILDKQFTYKKR